MLTTFAIRDALGMKPITNSEYICQCLGSGFRWASAESTHSATDLYSDFTSQTSATEIGIVKCLRLPLHSLAVVNPIPQKTVVGVLLFVQQGHIHRCLTIGMPTWLVSERTWTAHEISS